jgi:hypothetical protein
MSCDIKGHVGKITDWGLDDNNHWKGTKFGCTKCDWVGDDYPPEIIVEKEPEDHSNCESKPCFACKVKSLQINTGDAKAASGSGMTNKEWDNELNAYRKARAEGIQPAGTSMKAINEARRASEAMGKAYDSDTMINSKAITKESVSTLKELEQI